MCFKPKNVSFCPGKAPNAQAGEVHRTLIAASRNSGNQDWPSSVALPRLQTGQGIFGRFLHCVGAVEAEVGWKTF